MASMQRSPPRTFASIAAASSNNPPTASKQGKPRTQDDSNPSSQASTRSTSRERHQRPQTSSPDQERVYILTLLTDDALHRQMTGLRKKYFPPHLNKLEAHLTLFHALPGSHLENAIIPQIASIAAQTTSFSIQAYKVFRLRKGIAVAISRYQGGAEAEQVHRGLRDSWRPQGFLSEQDEADIRLHYTIMNKVDDERAVAAAFEDLQHDWTPRAGKAVGLGLWLYDRGRWQWQKGYMFADVQTG